LIFAVPTTIVDVPAQGRSALLTIANGIQPPAMRQIFLSPAFILQGSVDVDYIGVDSGDLSPTLPTVFEFSLTSRATLGATYSIRPAVTGISNAADFNKNLQVLDEQRRLVSSKTIDLNAGEQRTFFIRINPVPSGSSGTFDLKVEAVSGASTGSSGTQTLTVGQAPPQPDSTITINFSSSQIFPATDGTVTTTEIRLKKGAQVRLTLQAIFMAVGTYDITPLLNTGSDWSLALFAQSTVSPVDIVSSDLSGPGRTAPRLLQFVVGPDVSPGHTPSTTGKVEFRVKNRAINEFRTYGMDLTLLP